MTSFLEMSINVSVLLYLFSMGQLKHICHLIYFPDVSQGQQFQAQDIDDVGMIDSCQDEMIFTF